MAGTNSTFRRYDRVSQVWEVQRTIEEARTVLQLAADADTGGVETEAHMITLRVLRRIVDAAQEQLEQLEAAVTPRKRLAAKRTEHFAPERAEIIAALQKNGLDLDAIVSEILAARRRTNIALVPPTA